MARADEPQPNEAVDVGSGGRPLGLAGSYLEQALKAFEAASNPERLYEGFRDKADLTDAAEGFALLAARQERVTNNRTAVLFAALAAEAYVNEFLAVYLSGQDYDSVDRMRPVDKYVLGTRLACGELIFARDREPVPALRELFALRNKLAHPRPGFGPANLLEPEGDFEALFIPSAVARFLVMVASSAVILVRRAYGSKTLDVPADFIWHGRSALLDFANRAARMPSRLQEREPPLFGQLTATVAGQGGASQ
ncbi:MAG TPA: hypothetical protein VH247_00895 [Thermoleophilaceae bacterium]|jgi:hypothetical protein|nr:hypothetical protein [Thermoleophilaceae bacterium]